MFARPSLNDKSKLLDFAKAAREERALDRKRENAAIKIQALVRKYLARCKVNRLVRREIDEMLQISDDIDMEYKPALKPALEVFHAIQKFFLGFDSTADCQRFEFLLRYILHSLNSETMNKNVYVSVMLSKDHVSAWISQLKELLLKSSEYLQILSPDRHADSKMIITILHFQVTFTNANTWKCLTNSKNGDLLKPGVEQLCKNCMGHLTTHGLYSSLRSVLIKGLCKSKPTLKTTMLAAIFTISIRPLVASDFSETLFTSFLLEILSVPAVIHHISVLSIESLVLLMTHRIFSRSLDLLMNEQSTKIIFNVLEGNYALCLLANLIQLGNAEKEGLVESTRNFMNVATKLLEQCKQYVKNKKSNLTHWHPVLGWFAQKTDTSLNDAMPLVVQQLSELWNIKMINLLFEPLFSFASSVEPVSLNSNHKESHCQTSKTSFLKKALDRFSYQGSSGKTKVDASIVFDTCCACKVYMTALQSLSQLKMGIMAGLCFQDILLPRLWMLMTHLGPQCGLKMFLDTMSTHDIEHPLFSLLQLSCDTAKHVITILDDVEMYEQEHPFPLQMLVSISAFLKEFVYRTIWNGYIDVATASTNQVFLSTSSLLQILHSRDCRRSFTPGGHWLIKEIKSNNFMSDLAHNKPIPNFLLQKMSHIIPHKERISLFRKYVAKDKESLGISSSAHSSSRSTIITVHRSRLIEDGYRQLITLSPPSLKGIIRVKFINEQGLDEAGIDQDGVFKEFLEETIKKVFDPSLNLFKATGEQKLYPSPTSHLQDNHLALFEFVGRILGKAVYEGIVVDVPFASFFLSQLLGHTHSITYSSIDELPSLDPELYKSLTYIKHYKGDVTDLDLTFSYDEDVMGKVVTHELVPGGKVTSVTNENKISYLHLMAHFKMRVIIKDQSNAFIRGFKSIISSEWLDMFSGPELQKLISGDTNDIDLDDLRKHTHYYGGFHNNHRVIDWLWDILKKDFTSDERRLFLKFVTSCSKGPLLGFAHLEPPFSIRCVEVSEDQDSGDTVGSVLKGFFNIRKKDPVGRLPTSSTCFNLLKLPNYQKKSTLKEKLRYSITSNTGFELS